MILNGQITGLTMAKKKRKSSNTPRRKRFNRKQRLDSAKHWLPDFEGKNIARAYRKHYGVDWVSAFIELEMLGVKIDSQYQEKVLESVRAQTETKKRKRLPKNIEEVELPFDQDENFAYIAGYTSGGFPYGVTWEEWEELSSSELNGIEHSDATVRE
jgi:hypothetical protein